MWSMTSPTPDGERGWEKDSEWGREWTSPLLHTHQNQTAPFHLHISNPWTIHEPDKCLQTPTFPLRTLFKQEWPEVGEEDFSTVSFICLFDDKYCLRGSIFCYNTHSDNSIKAKSICTYLISEDIKKKRATLGGAEGAGLQHLVVWVCN